jgi:hypothetical protein
MISFGADLDRMPKCQRGLVALDRLAVEGKLPYGDGVDLVAASACDCSGDEEMTLIVSSGLNCRLFLSTGEVGLYAESLNELG